MPDCSSKRVLLKLSQARGSVETSDMARFLTLSTRGGAVHKGKRDRTIRRRVNIGPVTLSFVSIFILCLLSLFYLAQANQTATNGYQIRELEEELDVLKEENKKLELKAAELQSVRKVEEGVKHLNMIPIDKLMYITPAGTVVALQE